MVSKDTLVNELFSEHIFCNRIKDEDLFGWDYVGVKERKGVECVGKPSGRFNVGFRWVNSGLGHDVSPVSKVLKWTWVR